MKKIFSFDFFQRLGKTFMVVISLLPAAGLLLGLGVALQSPYLIDYLPFLENEFFQGLARLMKGAGNAIFSNLGVLFAIGIAGSWSGGKSAASLSALVGYLIMHTVVGIVAGVTQENVSTAGFTTELGIPTLQIGVFGGIIMGFVAANLYKKYNDFKLPEVLSFFGGARFVPIVTAAWSIIIGLIFAFVWPSIQEVIFALGTALSGEDTPAYYMFFYGVVERGLIPFGLHHIFYIPIRFSEVGGMYTTLAGSVVSGDTAMYMAQLADKQINDAVEITAGRFMAGKYPFVLFGLPAVALAMYHSAKPKNKKAVAGLLFTAAGTAFLTGITEPIEFTFLFVAPLLYVFHTLMAGLSFMLMYMLDVNIGYAGGSGIIDFTLFGILPGVGEPWWYVILVGLALAVVYYVVFRWAIAKFNLLTPGRGDEDSNRLYSKDEFQEKAGIKKGTSKDQKAIDVLAALGGQENINNLDACITRLRVGVNNKAQVDKDQLKALGAVGVLEVGNGVQAIFGPTSEVLKNQIADVIDNDDVAATVEEQDTILLAAPMTGQVVALEDIPDQVFSEKMMGDGIAIIPSDGQVVSPIEGKVLSVFPTKHAIALKSGEGMEVLIHMGLDTVQLKGDGFDIQVTEGDTIKQGDILANFNIEKISQSGYNTITPIIITNGDQFGIRELTTSKNVQAGKSTLLEVK